ncbi:hypothetical protein RHMOL_Rhmol06G0205900 [Rhododendron molle]|uniref:Uncharacterized protein n=1 Tax=Rhododendron molle TaxID=49168 RepID=A0ACC0NGS3_RHOML|nr:hypothetical protein RHMOL_Rhmol06G0205900 [Rhododendron molle]
MIVAHCLPLSTSPPPSKLGANSLKAPSLSLLNSKFGRNELRIKCSCVKEEETAKVFEDFSVLGSYIPWDSGSVWSTMAIYLFSLHVPLSFGGLAVVAHVLHQPVLDPQTQVRKLSVIMINFSLLVFG